MKNNEIRKLVSISALITAVGILFSGPVGVHIISMVKPQSSWEGVNSERPGEIAELI
jgi:hypothetical protein